MLLEGLKGVLSSSAVIVAGLGRERRSIPALARETEHVCHEFRSVTLSAPRKTGSDFQWTDTSWRGHLYLGLLKIQNFLKTYTP